jgi:hypothetical protein
MDIVKPNELLKVTGGNAVFVAIGVGISTYAGACTLIKSTQTLNDFGHTLGEQVFNSTHPDQLGQMVYQVDIIVESSDPNN